MSSFISSNNVQCRVLNRFADFQGELLAWKNSYTTLGTRFWQKEYTCVTAVYYAPVIIPCEQQLV